MDRRSYARAGLAVSLFISAAMLWATTSASWGAHPAGTLAARNSGSLKVRVDGLPPGQAASGVLHGPHGFRRSLHGTRLAVRRAAPGEYRLTLRSVRIRRTVAAIT